MKKIPIALAAAILLSLQLAAQNSNFKGNNMLMPSNLMTEYIVPLKRYLPDDSGMSPHVKNQSQADIFLICLDAALSGSVQLYAPYRRGEHEFNAYEIVERLKLLTESEIRSNLGERTDTILIENSNGDLQYEVYPMPIDTNALAALLFYEEWQITESPLAMTKEVAAFSPVLLNYGDESIFARPAFLAPNIPKNEADKNASDARMILTNSIEYEYFLEMDYPLSDMRYEIARNRDNLVLMIEKNKYSAREKSPYLNLYGISRFAENILKKATSGELPAYDFESGKALSPQEVYHRMDGGTDTISFENINGEMETRVLEREMIPQEINSLIFTEDWYVDPQTLRMKKTVRAISFVRQYYREDDWESQDPVRRVIFTIRLEN